MMKILDSQRGETLQMMKGNVRTAKYMKTDWAGGVNTKKVAVEVQTDAVSASYSSAHVLFTLCMYTF